MFAAMRRRRIAVFAAALAGIAAVVSPLWRPPAQEPPDHFRVELQASALDSALWFVARYPEYFTTGEAGLLPWLDSLDPRDRVFVLAMAQTLAWTWFEHESDQFASTQPVDLAREASLAIRAKALSQLDVNFGEAETVEGLDLWATITEPEFAPGVFARLVRGATNCEGYAHLLAVLLDVALDARQDGPWWRPKLRSDITGLHGHNLAMVHGPELAQPIFVDAWSNLPPFCYDRSRPATAIPLAELAQHGPLIEGDPGREPSPAPEYARAGPIIIDLVPERDAPTLPVALRVEAPSLDADSLARIDDPWRVFLFARVLQLYDDPRAAEVYAHLLARHCEGLRGLRPYPCMIAMTFRDRGA